MPRSMASRATSMVWRPPVPDPEPREMSETRAAVREHGPTGAELPEMDLDDPYHRAFVRSIFEAHAHGKSDFERFYEHYRATGQRCGH